MAKFDIERARKDGYTDTDIVDLLANESPDFDVTKARQDGHSDTDIANLLASREFRVTPWEKIKGAASDLIASEEPETVTEAPAAPKADEPTAPRQSTQIPAKPAAAAGLTATAPKVSSEGVAMGRGGAWSKKPEPRYKAKMPALAAPAGVADPAHAATEAMQAAARKIVPMTVKPGQELAWLKQNNPKALADLQTNVGKQAAEADIQRGAASLDATVEKQDAENQAAIDAEQESPKLANLKSGIYQASGGLYGALSATAAALSPEGKDGFSAEKLREISTQHKAWADTIASESSKQNFRDADSKLDWMVDQFLLNAPSTAVTLTSIFSPATAPLALGTMATYAGGGHYTELVNAGVDNKTATLAAVGYGAVEAAIERAIPVELGQQVLKKYRAMPLLEQAKMGQRIVRGVTATGAAGTAMLGTEGAEELVTGLIQRSIDKAVKQDALNKGQDDVAAKVGNEGVYDLDAMINDFMGGVAGGAPVAGAVGGYGGVQAAQSKEGAFARELNRAIDGSTYNVPPSAGTGPGEAEYRDAAAQAFGKAPSEPFVADLAAAQSGPIPVDGRVEPAFSGEQPIPGASSEPTLNSPTPDVALSPADAAIAQAIPPTANPPQGGLTRAAKVAAQTGLTQQIADQQAALEAADLLDEGQQDADKGTDAGVAAPLAHGGNLVEPGSGGDSLPQSGSDSVQPADRPTGSLAGSTGSPISAGTALSGDPALSQPETPAESLAGAVDDALDQRPVVTTAMKENTKGKKAKQGTFATPEQEQERARLIADIDFYENTHPRRAKTADMRRDGAKKLAAAQKALKKLPAGMLTRKAILALNGKPIAETPLVQTWIEGAQIALEGAKSADEAIEFYKANGGEFISDDYFRQQFAQQAATPVTPVTPKAKKKRALPPVKDAEEFGQRARKEFLKHIKDMGGIKTDEARDISGEPAHIANRMLPGLFRTGGNALDLVARRLNELGYLSDDAYNDVDGGVQAVRDLIGDALAGNPVMTLEDEQRYRELVERENALQFEADNPAEVDDIAEEVSDELADDLAGLDDDEIVGLDDDFLPGLDAPAKPMDEADAMRAMGFSEDEIKEALNGRGNQEAATGDRGQADEAVAERPEDRPATGGREDQDEGFGLQAQTEQDLTDADRRRQQAAADKAKADADADTRAQADAERDTFTLTGSDRPADANPGQGDIFGSRPARPSANTLFTNDADERAGVAKDSDAGGAEASGSDQGEVAPQAELQPNSAKIESFGEKVVGRRDSYRKAYSDKMERAIGEDIAAVPLSKSWPEPDYEKLLEDGADAWAVSFIHAARDEIPSKPGVAWKQKRWAEQVRQLRGMANSLIDGTLSSAAVRSLLADDQFRLLRETVGSRADLYEAVGHAKSLKGIKVSVGHYGIFDGKAYNPPKVIWSVSRNAKATAFSNMPSMLAMGDTREEAIANFRQKIAGIELDKPAAKQVKFDLYSYRGKDGVWIGKKVGKGYIDLKHFASSTEARLYLADKQAELEALLAKKKAIPSERRTNNTPRVGVDHRNGQDVTPEMFGETFGFKGVRFGESMPNAERIAHLNQTYDALMDMAGVLGVPAKALSLNGELNIAFGALGTGGKNPAAAHYESETIVVNLTRKNGPGSLAHEWFHGVDNYFSRARGKKSAFTTEALDVKLAGQGAEYFASGMRKEMIAAFGTLVNAINTSEIVARSRALDSRRSKPYWSTKLEMAARAFESYVIAKLQDQGASNDYLANIVSKEYWDAEEALGMEDAGTYPYPTAEEMPAVRAAFDNFFNVIEAVETEDGTMILREPGAQYGAAESDAPYTHDLFGEPLPAGKPVAKPKKAASKGEQPKGVFASRTKLVVENVREIGAPRVNSIEEAAQALSYLGRHAVERFDALVTDKNGKPLAIVGSFKGALTQTSVYPATITGEAFRIEGAANIWFAHNHPSGLPDLSTADRHLYRSVVEVFRGSAIKTRGLFAIAGNTSDARQWMHVDDTGDFDRGTTGTPTKTVKVPVMERVYDEMGFVGDPVTSPSIAKDVAHKVAAGQSGIMLMDAQNRPIAFVPVAKEDTMPLRENGRMDALYRALSLANAGAGIVVNQGDYSQEQARNLARFIGSIEVRALDVMDFAPASGARVESWAETGKDFGGGVFFKRANGLSDEESLRRTVRVQMAVNDIRKGWKNAPEIIVVPDMNDGRIPREVQDADAEMKAQGATGEPRGFISGGKVYIVAGQHKTLEDVMETIAHETLGHAGLRGFYGDALTPILRQIVAARRADVDAKVAEYGFDPENADHLLMAAEEVLANFAQTRPEMGYVKRAVAAIRQWLRDIGLNLTLTDNDIIANYILPARAFIEKGGKPGGGGGKRARFARKNKAMTREQFYNSYAQHVDIRGRDGSAEANRAAIKRDGFKQSMNVNAMPASRGGKPGNVIEHKYQPKAGDTVYLVPRSGWTDGPNGIQIRNGWKPQPHEVITITDPERPMYEYYLEALGDDVMFARGQRQIPGTQAAPMPQLTRQAPLGITGGFAGSQATWSAPIDTAFDDFVYKWQNKHVDTKRVVQAITEATGQLAERWNPYLQEELFHGRAAKRTLDFVERELNPMLHKAAELGLKMDEIEAYLHARHAEEANRLIAQRDPNMPDGGSGMMTADARAYFRTLPADKRRDLAVVAKLVDAMIDTTRQLYADYGLESQDTVDEWGRMFRNYVPLMREDKDGGMGIGQGYSIKGREAKHRTGSARKVVDILGNIALQREKVIVRGEKNRVAVSLAGIAKLNPNPDFWTFDVVPNERVLNEKTGLVESRPDPLFKSRPNVIVAKIKGRNGEVKERAIIFNEQNDRAMRMAESLKNMDVTPLEGVVMPVFAAITRYMASINTQYNPVFGFVNLTRDVQGAMLNLSSTPLKDKKAAIFANTFTALAGIYRDARAERKGGQATSPWANEWDEFTKEGGQTGYRDMFANGADRAKAIQKALDPTLWMQSKLGRIFTVGGALKVPLSVAQKKVGWLFDWLSDFNTTMENAVRLAAYKAAKEQGMSRQQAASLAKNLTVNFNRRGQVGQQAGALYAFFNAATQGTARIGETLTKMEPGKIGSLRLSGAGKAIIGGGVLLGAMQAVLLAAMGFDDDEPPEFVRERNLILPLGLFTGQKNYLTVPMPLGFHVFPNIGRHAVEALRDGKPGAHAAEMLGIVAEAFNPFGSAGMSLQTLAPSAFDPFVALAENKDWTGKKIYREDYGDELEPGFERAKDTASIIAKSLAEAIHYATGGTEYTAGRFSPSPDQIDYLIAQFTGGVGRELSKAEQAITAGFTGEELPAHKIPLAGRYYGTSEGLAGESGQYYTNLDRARRHEKEIMGRLKDGQDVDDYYSENTDADIWRDAKGYEKRIKALRKEKLALIRDKAERPEIREIENEIAETMREFNDLAKELREDQAIM